jgi:PncC family amidohydrolase
MLEKTLAKILLKKKLTVAVAESCTGGLIAHTFTNIPGSSSYFLCGIVAYANLAKIRFLKISPDIIKEHGAVSKETAMAMAGNIKHLAQACIGVGVTGLAGPGGGLPLKPVGTVFIAVSYGHHTYFKKFAFKGNRLRIKEQARDAALGFIYQCLR